MSDVKDRPVMVTVDGQEYAIMFDLNVWEEVLETYATPFALMRGLLSTKDGPRIKAVKTALAALLPEAVNIYNENNPLAKMKPAPTKAQLGRKVQLEDVPAMVDIIMEAFNRGLPAPKDDEPKNSVTA